VKEGGRFQWGEGDNPKQPHRVVPRPKNQQPRFFVLCAAERFPPSPSVFWLAFFEQSAKQRGERPAVREFSTDSYAYSFSIASNGILSNT